jgi:16S rRNA (cytosine1402-N4)-methyltransferase
MQFDQGHKGFSFSKEGPLDMRMDPESSPTAKEIVNQYSERELGDLFRELGEEPRWRKAAHAVVDARKKKRIETTVQLAEILKSALGFRGKGRLHPATLVFEALRIAVNKELESIQNGLSKAIHLLTKGGRMGAISFHSLEDRIVKNVFKEAGFRQKEKGPIPLLKILTKKPLTAALAEVRANPRARSAKMRFAEKI